MTSTREREFELFNTIVKGLASQEFQQSINAKTCMCQYRGDNNKRCAVGWIIEDKLYTPALESLSCNDVCEFIGLQQYSEFLFQLQLIHDSNSEPSDMVAALLRFADKKSFKHPQELINYVTK